MTTTSQKISILLASVLLPAGILAQPAGGGPAGPGGGPPNQNSPQALERVKEQEAMKPLVFDRSKAKGPQGDSYSSIAKLPDLSGAWALDSTSFGVTVRTSHGDEDIPPFTQDMSDLRKLNIAEGIYGDGFYNNSVDCIPDGVPAMMTAPFAFEYLLTPDQVTIISENFQVRRIFTDGRGHNQDGELYWMGDSIGYWENGTLVVETTNINPKAEFFVGMWVTENTRFIERISKVNDKQIRIETTAFDDEVFTAPYNYIRTYELSDVGMVESFCNEGNRGTDDEMDITPPPL